MADWSDYQLAHLRPELVQRIKQLETELSSELDQPVVLLAYDKWEKSDKQN